MSSLIASLISMLIWISPPTLEKTIMLMLLESVMVDTASDYEKIVSEDLDAIWICVDAALPSRAPLINVVHCIRLHLKINVNIVFKQIDCMITQKQS